MNEQIMDKESNSAITTVASNIEEWRPVIGWEAFYEVSSLGHVRRHDSYRHKGFILKATPGNYGYPRVTLSKIVDGRKHTKCVNVHRLVAEAFIPNPYNKPCVDHINTIRTDNSITNLRWVTYAENYANPISKEKLRKALKATKSSEEGRETNRRAQILCKGTPEARAESSRQHDFQKKWIMCVETGEKFHGIRTAAKLLGYKSSYSIASSIKRYLEGKPQKTGLRNGRIILHFIPAEGMS